MAAQPKTAPPRVAAWISSPQMHTPAHRPAGVAEFGRVTEPLLLACGSIVTRGEVVTVPRAESLAVMPCTRCWDVPLPYIPAGFGS